MSDDRPERPFLQIVRGEPSAEEVAALVAVLTARARASAQAPDGADTPRPSRWADRSRLVRGTAAGVATPRGPGAWKAAALPR
ncbi:MULTISPECIES: acyl-CoA carboxylase subunit epsilon [Actinomadura]|uniref:acyl-CoA carboxylase subunit epsilon n=1 Tax=Actinomadura TaxID=1988 RepID=UPI0027DFF3C7|nr:MULTISPECIES: acyl-CoA carboxylase subunit epsilon [Actinomadura]